MSTFVLIHGAFHGGWCWDRVVPLLEAMGHTLVAPDLPGHGNDQTALVDITLQAYVEKVCDILNMQTERVILVGHSMGGIVITQAAERCPSKIKKLVYLAAILLGNGSSMPEEESLVKSNLFISEDQSCFALKEDMIRPAFYADCSDAEVEWAKSKLTPQPLKPLDQSATTITTKKNYGSIPRVYIECLHDKAITPATQKKLYSDMPCEQVISMATDHSPFLSAPKSLAQHLSSLS